MLAFENYKKRFGSTTVVNIGRMELPYGIYWLKGENGSGKTTLIKSIAGLIPFDGDISVSGCNIRHSRIAYTSIVNYAEAEPVYPDFLTGNDLITFYKETKKAGNAQVSYLIEALGIANYADKKVGTYSSGMAKKLSLALGFMGEPKLILLDEPLITLDMDALKALQEVIMRYHMNGVSFLITSHQELTFQGFAPTRLLIRDKTLLLA